jgi:3-oxoacyl-[acyl-carrier-protein] synthase II
MELAASIVGMNAGEVPMTLNYDEPDPECPVNVIRGEPLRARNRSAIKLSTSRLGHAAAILISSD